MEILYKIMVGYFCACGVLASIFVLGVLANLSNWLKLKAEGK